MHRKVESTSELSVAALAFWGMRVGNISRLAQPGAWALEKSLTRPLCFLYFREIGGKRSHWPGGQSAPFCRARRPKISQHLDRTSWRFNLALKHHLLGNSYHCVWFFFTLGLHKWPLTRLGQMFEMSHAPLKQWQVSLDFRRRIFFVQDSITKTRFILSIWFFVALPCSRSAGGCCCRCAATILQSSRELPPSGWDTCNLCVTWGAASQVALTYSIVLTVPAH